MGQGEIEILPCGGTQILATVSGRKEKTKMYTENKTLKIQKNGNGHHKNPDSGAEGYRV